MVSNLPEPLFEIQSDKSGKYRFHLKAANGQIIASSQSYESKQACQEGIAAVKKLAPTAKIVDFAK